MPRIPSALPFVPAFALLVLPLTRAAAAPGIDLGERSDGEACVVVGYPDGTIRESDGERCAERLRPASTFKLVNTLIAADLGLVKTPATILRHDAKRYPRQRFWPRDWARNHDLRKAMEISALPLFQRLATRVGERRMQAALDALGYGNRSLGGAIDRFWLDGSLRVSAREQVAFVAGLVKDDLGASAHARALVREVVPRETAADGSILHAKTGTALRDGREWIGWLVGWVDHGGQPHPFACWIKPPPGDFAAVRARRTEVCRGALDRLGLFPAPN
jgi:beta-lactamase class D